jgi:hypothetical protein
LASVVALRVVKRRPRTSTLGLWSLQAVLALIAFSLTVEPFELAEPGAEVRVAPPLALAGIAGEIAGLLANGPSRPRPPRPGEEEGSSAGRLGYGWRVWL